MRQNLSLNGTVSIYDIGPAAGKPPDLISQPDGIVNFEDLMVFCLMWKWNKKTQNLKLKTQNLSLWMEEEGDWVVVKYRGLADALGGRYILKFDQGVEAEKVESGLKAFVWERIDNNLILEFGLIDAEDSGEVCRIKIKNGIKIQGEGEIRDSENKKILVENYELSLKTISLKEAKCYPNPSRTGEVRFFDVPSDTSIQIYNIAGELIFSDERFNSRTWPTKNIASGTYIYILTSGKDKKTGKIAVVK